MPWPCGFVAPVEQSHQTAVHESAVVVFHSAPGTVEKHIQTDVVRLLGNEIVWIQVMLQEEIMGGGGDSAIRCTSYHV